MMSELCQEKMEHSPFIYDGFRHDSHQLGRLPHNKPHL